MSKTDYSITRQMQIDLIQAYKNVHHTSWSQREAYEKTVKQPAPRYYVSPKQAYQIIAPMMRGDFEKVNLMMPTRRKMYYSLFRVVVKLSEKREFCNKSLWYIMPFAVTSPAPEFFICEERARHIREWLGNGNIREDGSINEEKIKSYATNRARRQQRRKERKEWILART